MQSRYVLSAVLLASLSGCGSPQGIPDGTYYGYEFMSNLSPDDPEVDWYHELVLTVQGSRVHVEKYPRWTKNDTVVASSSDGGLYTLDGSLESAAGRTLVKLRLVSCDYCAEPRNLAIPPTAEREFVVLFAKDGSFEIDRVTYSSSPNPRLHPASGA